jgi:hypothetical protein
MWLENGNLLIGVDRSSLSNKEITLSPEETLLIYKGLSRGIDYKLLINEHKAMFLKRVHVAEIIKKWGV